MFYFVFALNTKSTGQKKVKLIGTVLFRNYLKYELIWAEEGLFGKMFYFVFALNTKSTRQKRVRLIGMVLFRIYLKYELIWEEERFTSQNELGYTI